MIVLLLLPSVILSADAYVTNAADVKLRACDTERECCHKALHLHLHLHIQIRVLFLDNED